MATMTFSVSDKLKKRFDKEFANEDKSQIFREFMKKAIEQAIADRNMLKRRARAVDAILEFRAKMKPVSEKQIRKAREYGRQ